MQALEPILEDVLVVGGWAHRLHREHPLASASADAPVQTSDCDIAFGLKSPAPQGLDLQVRFRLAGFDYEHTGTELQESGVFRSRVDPTFTVQLLVPRRGSGTTRAGDPVRTQHVGGVPVEVLRGLDLLEIEPWKAPWVVSSQQRLELSICHPVPFALGKLLLTCVPSRPIQHRAKDLIYILDTTRLFAGREVELLREVPALAERVGRAHRREIRAAHEESLRSESPVLHLALQFLDEMRGGRPRIAADVVRTCRDGLAPALAALGGT
jgi:hypothetical protein